ncbi:hypothetical protein acsn021_02590 [Anaerocolumna cellulosilytica]|uniref:Uncharacterized protein n=1 Tax=Anaerocolumna cellulosilytica TaxID=433286 RepID=A0A6S6R020_9FIRM|nr:hypothetical protein [Anaerocolumna cellulosilytica]MBB5196908.1 hypothetical protein [Anaerocolumna cellulosilytica]BCJ92690.1 hypothetical protein acsn021_02590 [Anaerocolumna cellulosilytica]
MEYFILQHDNRLLEPLQIKKQDCNLLTKEPFILPCEMEENTWIPEFFVLKELFEHYFFVSDRLKELLDIYSKEVEAIPCFLTDIKRQRQECFWKIELPEIYHTMQEDNVKMSDLCMDEQQVQGRYLFLLSSGKRKYGVVSLHLAEHMLRKNYYGILYIPVKVS